MKSHRLSHDTIITGVVLIIAAAALTLDSWVYFQIRNYIITVQNTPLSTEEASVEWQTLSNNDLGFQINYPTNRLPIEIHPDDTIERTVFGDLPGLFTIDVIKNTAIDNYIAQDFKDNPSCTNRKNIKLNSYDAVLYTCVTEFDGGRTDTFLIARNNNIYELNFGLVPVGKEAENVTFAISDTDQKMLDSFRFTDDMSDWQTYINNQSHYSFQYPRSWNAGEYDKTGTVLIHPPLIPSLADSNDDMFIVVKLKDKAEREKSIAALKKDLVNFQQTTTTVGGKAAIRITGKSLINPSKPASADNYRPADVLFVANNNSEYQIVNQTSADSSPFTEEFTTFLSRFKFIDDISDWQTYTNSDYSFSLKYPQNWKTGNFKGDVSGCCFVGTGVVAINSIESREGDHEGAGEALRVYLNDIPPSQYVSQYNKMNSMGLKDVQWVEKSDKITVAGVEATHMRLGTPIGSYYEVIFFSQGVPKPFYIEYDDYDPLHLQILSTLSFSNPKVLFDVTTIKSQDKVANMTVQSVGPYNPAFSKLTNNNARVVFSGTTTVTATYTHFGPDNMLGNTICLSNIKRIDGNYVDLPRIQGDERNGSGLCLTNYEQAKSFFGQPDTSGQAEMVIKDFVINYYPSEVTDRALFVKRIK